MGYLEHRATDEVAHQNPMREKNCSWCRKLGDLDIARSFGTLLVTGNDYCFSNVTTYELDGFSVHAPKDIIQLGDTMPTPNDITRVARSTWKIHVGDKKFNDIAKSSSALFIGRIGPSESRKFLLVNSHL